MQQASRNFRAVALLAVASVFGFGAEAFPLAARALAAWSNDPSVNTAVAESAADESYSAIGSLADGSVIVAWARATGAPWTSDIYVQRMSRSGLPLWGQEGLLLAGGDLIQESAAVATDVNGFSFVAWCEQSSTGSALKTTLRVQKVDPNGHQVWAAGGVVLSSTTDVFEDPLIVADGHGGAFLGWTDARKSGSQEDSTDAYVQHVLAKGTLAWRSAGVPVSRAPGHQCLSGLDSDGRGGVVVAWRSGVWTSPAYEDTYVQRIDASGAPAWPIGGVLVWHNQVIGFNPLVVSDKRGGAYVTWVDAAAYQIRGQYFRTDGSESWGPGGILVAANIGQMLDRYTLRAFPGGGFVFGWADARLGGYQAYLQRVSAEGQVLWGNNGLRAAPLSPDSEGLDFRVSPAGETMVCYEDFPTPGDENITATFFRADGTRPANWPDSGVPVSTAPGLQANPKIAMTSEGAVACWRDTRSPFNPDIYAQRVLWNGKLGAPSSPSPRPFVDESSPKRVLHDRAVESESGMPTDTVIRLLSSGGESGVNAERAFEIALPHDADVAIAVLDSQGRVVGEVPPVHLQAGIRTLVFSPHHSLPHGILMARLVVDGVSRSTCKFPSW